MRADPRMEQVDEAEHLLGELESIEQQLSRLQEGLSRSHRLAMLGTMASTLAHEYNNILTPVISYCQMANQSPGDTAMMQKAVDRALSGGAARRANQ